MNRALLPRGPLLPPSKKSNYSFMMWFWSNLKHNIFICLPIINYNKIKNWGFHPCHPPPFQKSNSYLWSEFVEIGIRIFSFKVFLKIGPKLRITYLKRVGRERTPNSKFYFIIGKHMKMLCFKFQQNHNIKEQFDFLEGRRRGGWGKGNLISKF